MDESWATWGSLALVAGAGGYALRSHVARWAFRRRARRGRQGEVDAERMLRRAGYRLIARQPTRVLRYAVDGEPMNVTVRADLLVERRGRRYVAEVKTGRVAPRLKTAETRRQLLEYAHAYDVDGLLLVDADRGLIRQVRVPLRHRPVPWLRVAGLIALGVALGVLAARAYPGLTAF